jgi:nucleolar protein 15
MAKRQATTSAAAPAAKKAKVPAKESTTEGKAASAKKGATKANESVKQTKAPTPPPEETNKPATRKRKTASDFIELDGESSKATTTKDVGTDKQPASKKKVKVSQPAEVGPSKKLAAKQETIKTAKAPAPSKSVLKPTVPKESVSVEQGREEEEEEDTFVHGFTSSSEGGADSSDEDDSDFEGDDAAIAAEKSGKGKKALDVAKLPTVAKDDKSVQRKLAKARRKQVSRDVWGPFICSPVELTFGGLVATSDRTRSEAYCTSVVYLTVSTRMR